MAIIDYIGPAGEKIDEYELRQRFDEMLDEDQDSWPVIAGRPYQPSRALRLVDETAYRTDFNDWVDGEGYEEV